MRYVIVGIMCVLLVLSTTLAQEQSTESLDCETYVVNLVNSIDGLQNRLKGFVYSSSAIISDLMAFVDLRRQWEDMEPPECAKDIHSDVISLFANVTDAGAFAAAMKLDFARSRERYFEETVDRIAVYQAVLAKSLSKITGTEIAFKTDLGEIFGMILEKIQDDQ